MSGVSNTHPLNQVKTMNQTTAHIFLGYLDNINRYLCFNLDSGKIVVSRDVIFVEDDFSKNVKLQSLSDHFTQDFVDKKIGRPNHAC